MGELEKEKGAWGYVEGGMGGVSQSIARSARSLGADIFTERVSVQGEGVTFCMSRCFCFALISKNGMCPGCLPVAYFASFRKLNKFL